MYRTGQEPGNTSKETPQLLLWCLHAYSLCPHADQHAHGSCTLVWSFLCKSFAFSPPGYLGRCLVLMTMHYMVTLVHCVCVCVCEGEGGGACDKQPVLTILVSCNREGGGASRELKGERRGKICHLQGGAKAAQVSFFPGGGGTWTPVSFHLSLRVNHGSLPDSIYLSL